MLKTDFRLPPSDLVNLSFKRMLDEYPTKLRREIIPIGMDADGNIIYKRISDLEDILVGGTTSSGKTNLLNNIICSILMKHKPTETKLVLIDTKGYEFNNYVGIPHLLTPLVTEPAHASQILNSLITGAINRRKIFDKNNVKTFDEYNNLVRREKRKDPNTKLEHLPNIVLVIDDYALISNEENKHLIEKLLEINNYTGIHVICGTSLPTKEVISEKMREYFYSRVSFHFVEDSDIKFILGTKKNYQVGEVNNYIFKTNDNKFYNLNTLLLEDKEISTIVDFLIYTNK